jgi:glycolate oxidase iron-sulfur subunit
VLGTEADSPRGRIHIMEAVKRGTLALDREAMGHLDGCLGCLACETACPSGVSFHQRIEEFRPLLRHRPLAQAWRALVARTSASPGLLRAARVVARSLDRAGLTQVRRATPGLAVFPESARRGTFLTVAPLHVKAPERPRARVALLEGCAAAVLAPEIHEAAVQVLHRNGVAVVQASEQACCGALALHGGRSGEAAALARHNSDAFASVDVDYVVTTAAGCGAMLKDYGRVLAGDALAERGRALADKARDVSEVLCELGIVAPGRPLRIDGPVAYHDACHLLHAAKVARQPRALVEAAIGQPAIDLGENNVCCGSAGSYNLDQPALARVLGGRKAELAAEKRVGAIAVGNIGCILQIEQALARQGSTVPVLHPVELLAEAYARAG